MSTETKKDKMPEIEVCHGPQCSDFGGRTLSQELEALGIDSCVGDCRSQCPNAPVVLVDKRMIIHATVEKIQHRIKTILD